MLQKLKRYNKIWNEKKKLLFIYYLAIESFLSRQCYIVPMFPSELFCAWANKCIYIPDV